MGNIGQTGNHKYWTGCAERGTISKFNNFRGSHIHLKGTKGEGGHAAGQAGELREGPESGEGVGGGGTAKGLGGPGGAQQPRPSSHRPKALP